MCDGWLVGYDFNLHGAPDKPCVALGCTNYEIQTTTSLNLGQIINKFSQSSSNSHNFDSLFFQNELKPYWNKKKKIKKKRKKKHLFCCC